MSVGDDNEILVAPTLVFGRSLRNNWGAFFELAAEIPEEGSSAVLFHTGLTKAPNPRRQWDVHVAVGLSHAAPDLQVGAGYSFSF